MIVLRSITLIAFPSFLSPRTTPFSFPLNFLSVFFIFLIILIVNLPYILNIPFLNNIDLINNIFLIIRSTLMDLIHNILIFSTIFNILTVEDLIFTDFAVLIQIIFICRVRFMSMKLGVALGVAVLIGDCVVMFTVDFVVP